MNVVDESKEINEWYEKEIKNRITMNNLWL